LDIRGRAWNLDLTNRTWTDLGGRSWTLVPRSSKPFAGRRLRRPARIQQRQFWLERPENARLDQRARNS
jgi:hypothetical protein